MVSDAKKRKNQKKKARQKQKKAAERTQLQNDPDNLVPETSATPVSESSQTEISEGAEHPDSTGISIVAPANETVEENITSANEKQSSDTADLSEATSDVIPASKTPMVSNAIPVENPISETSIPDEIESNNGNSFPDDNVATLPSEAMSQANTDLQMPIMPDAHHVSSNKNDNKPFQAADEETFPQPENPANQSNDVSALDEPSPLVNNTVASVMPEVESPAAIEENIIKKSNEEVSDSQIPVLPEHASSEESKELESVQNIQETAQVDQPQPTMEEQLPAVVNEDHFKAQTIPQDGDIAEEIDNPSNIEHEALYAPDATQGATSQNDELQFDDHGDVEVDAMPWETTTREQISVDIHSNLEEQSNANLTLNASSNEMRVDTLSDLNLKDSKVDEDVIENESSLQQQAANAENLSSSADLFPDADIAGTEPMPWDAVSPTKESVDSIQAVPEVVQEPRTIENTLLPNTVSLDSSPPGDDEKREPSEGNTASNLQTMDISKEESATAEETKPIGKNNFSFMDDDEDLLEDDDSFLDSDEDLPDSLSKPIEVGNSVVESNATPNATASVSTTSTPVVHNVSKYTPQVAENQATTAPSGPFNNIDRVDLQSNVTNNITNNVSNPSTYQHDSFNRSFNKYTGNNQTNIDDIRQEKKKSDAYDFPSELLKSTVAPVHARVVGIPKGQYGSSPISNVGVPRARAPSTTYNPLTTSAAPPPSIGAKAPPYGPAKDVHPGNVPPQNARRTSTTHYVSSPQLLPNNNFAVQESPYGRRRTASIMSNGSTGSVPQPNNVRSTSRYAPPTTGVNSVPHTQTKYGPQNTTFQSPQIPSSTFPPNEVTSGQGLNQNRYAPQNATAQPLPFGINDPSMPMTNQPLHGGSANLSVPPQTNSIAGQGPPVLGHGRKTSNLYTPNQSGPGSKYAPSTQTQYYNPNNPNNVNSIAQTQPMYAPQTQNQMTSPSIARYPPVGGHDVGRQSANTRDPHNYDQSSHGIVSNSYVDNESLLRRQFPLFHWGKSNRVVYGIPVDNSAYGMNGSILDAVNVVNYDHVIKPSTAMKTYPGPLTSKTKKNDLEKWISDVTSDLPEDYSTNESLIWNILQSNLKSPGSYSDIANILFDTSSIVGFLSQSFNVPQPSLNAMRLDPNVQLRVLALLQIGNCTDALSLALEYKDFAMALLIGSLAGKEKWSAVVESYLRNELSGYSDSNANLLSLLFQVYLGNSKNAISNMYSNSEHNTWAVTNWRMIVAAILMNLSSIPELPKMKPGHLPAVILEFLIEFGILLNKRGFITEASVLFMIANVPLSLSPISPDCDVIFSHIGVPPSTQSLMWSEVYEYIRMVNEPEFKGYPALLSQKMNYAFSLEEESLSSVASKYNDYIISRIKLLPKRDASAINLMNSTNLLTARISDSGTGWLGKPKLSSVWGQLDKSFNKYIGGDDIISSKKTPEKSVFDSYTPYSSNHSSMVDLGQQNFTPFQQHHASHRPVQNLEQQPSLLPSNYSVDQTNRGAQHNFSEQSPFHQQGRIGDSLQGSPQRTFGNETKIPVSNFPPSLPRVHSEIFANAKTAASFKKQEPAYPSLKRSMTHDASKLTTAATLTSDILDVGPPPIVNRRTEPKVSSPDPPRRLSNLSNHSDILPPPRSRVPKSKTATRRPTYNYAPQTGNPESSLSSEITVPPSIDAQESSPSVEPVILQPDNNATHHEDTVIHTTPGKNIPDNNITKNILEEDMTAEPELIDSYNGDNSLIGADETGRSNVGSPNMVNAHNPPSTTLTFREGGTDDLGQTSPSPLKVIHGVEDHTNTTAPLATEEVVNDERHDIPVVPSEADNVPQTDNLEISQPDTVSLPSQMVSHDTNDELHGRTQYSELQNSELTEDNNSTTTANDAIVPHTETTQQESEETNNDIPQTSDVEESKKPDSAVNDTPEENHVITSEASTPTSSIDINSQNKQVDIPLESGVEEDKKEPGNMEHATSSISSEQTNGVPGNSLDNAAEQQNNANKTPHVEKSSPVQNNSEVALPPKQEPYPSARKPSVYAPSSSKPKTKRKVSSYLPANATALHSQLKEGVVQSGSEVDMFSYGGYHVAQDENQTNAIRKPLEPINNTSVESPKLQEVKTFNIHQDNQFKPQPVVNDRFGPIQNPDEISSEIFEPVIMKQPKNRFNTFTPSHGPTEFNDIIEEDSDEDAESEPKKEVVAKKAVQKKESSDGTEKPGWFGWLKNESGEKKAIKAKMGNANSFVFDPELKRWVNKNASEDEKKKLKEEATSLPPPPPIIKRKDTGPKTKPRVSISHSNPPSGASTPSTPDIAGETAMTNEGSTSSAPPMGPPKSGAPPIQKNTSGKNIPPAKTGSSLDDLLSMPKPGQTRRTKKKNNARYVNVLDQK